MKVIDVLNKIANGEEVPKTIMYDGDIWKYDELSNDYEMFDESGDLYLFQEELNITRALNDEVEIIEEDKKIEKLRQLCEYPSTNTYECWSVKEDILVNKINEIIDYLNKEER